MRRVHFIVGGFLLLFLLACANEDGEQATASYTDSTGASITEGSEDPVEESGQEPNRGTNVILLRDNSEIEFGGEAISQSSELSALVARKIANAKREVELTTNLVIDVDQETTVGFLKEASFALQVAGFDNIGIHSDEAVTKIPVAAAQSSEASLNLAIVTLATAGDGKLCGIKIDVNGDFLMIESADLDHLKKQTRTKLEKLMAAPSGEASPAIGRLEIELTSLPTLSAHQFSEICGTISSLIEAQDGPSSSKATLWPFGYPRETPLELGPIEMFDVMPGELDSNEKPQPQKELKPFDLQDSSKE